MTAPSRSTRCGARSWRVRSSLAPTKHLDRIVAWYFHTVYARLEGPGVLPFYCDPDRIGAFAVERSDLAAGNPDTLFRLFVTLAMYQARRDRLIMAQQKAMDPPEAALLSSPAVLAEAVTSSPCDLLRGSPEAFDQGCDVRLVDCTLTCGRYPGAPCPVKTAARLLRRMADLGKLPVSAWMRLAKDQALDRELAVVLAEEREPTRRAERLVRHLTSVYRVGTKLATLFVSVLSTPALAPGLTPWYPGVNGYELLVLDTNVAKVVDALRGPTARATPAERTRWLRTQAARIDPSLHGEELPAHSPRMVQQALYWFGSSSNRTAHGEPCATLGTRPCSECAPVACPFPARASSPPRKLPSLR